MQIADNAGGGRVARLSVLPLVLVLVIVLVLDPRLFSRAGTDDERRVIRKLTMRTIGSPVRCPNLREHTDGARSELKPETIAVHAGREIDPATGAVAPPIHLSTTFERSHGRKFSDRLQLLTLR